MLILMCLPENSRTELRTCGLYERDLQVFSVISWLCECKLHASWRTLFPEQKTVQELTVNFYKQTFYCWTILILFNVKKLGKLAYYLFPELLTRMLQSLSSFTEKENVGDSLYVLQLVEFLVPSLNKMASISLFFSSSLPNNATFTQKYFFLNLVWAFSPHSLL